MRTSTVERRSKNYAAVQSVADNGHKTIGGTLDGKPVAYSTEERRHQRNHPRPDRPPTIAPIPDSVEVWNVEAQCSVSIHAGAANSQVRFNLRRELWESIGRPNRVSVYGDPDQGFKVTWGGAYAVQYNSASKTSSISIMVSPTSIGLPSETRTGHVLKACSRAGMIEIDPPHELWLLGDPAFQPQALPRSTSPAARVTRLSAKPQTGAVQMPAKPNGHANSTLPHNGHAAPLGATSPLPRAATDLPAPTKVDLLKAKLKQKLDETLHAKAELERETGLKFKLTSKGSFVVDI